MPSGERGRDGSGGGALEASNLGARRGGGLPRAPGAGEPFGTIRGEEVERPWGGEENDEVGVGEGADALRLRDFGDGGMRSNGIYVGHKRHSVSNCNNRVQRLDHTSSGMEYWTDLILKPMHFSEAHVSHKNLNWRVLCEGEDRDNRRERERCRFECRRSVTSQRRSSAQRTA